MQSVPRSFFVLFFLSVWVSFAHAQSQVVVVPVDAGGVTCSAGVVGNPDSCSTISIIPVGVTSSDCSGGTINVLQMEHSYFESNGVLLFPDVPWDDFSNNAFSSDDYVMNVRLGTDTNARDMIIYETGEATHPADPNGFTEIDRSGLNSDTTSDCQSLADGFNTLVVPGWTSVQSPTVKWSITPRVEVNLNNTLTVVELVFERQ